MEYFNKKQDVIELKLTQFGRNLLSMGKFKPKYYSFFDDNVMYDSGKAGIVEEQNESIERIKQSQTMKTQTGFTSLEKEFELLFDHYDENRYDNLQKSAEKNYRLPKPIGTMDLNSKHAPAWGVNFLQGSITGSSNTLTIVGSGPANITGSNIVLDIPQLDSVMEIKTFGNSQAVTDINEAGLSGGSTIISAAEDENFILIKFVEANSRDQKLNFDLEIFEIEETTESGVTTETLRTLSFVPDNFTNSQILENIGPEIGPKYADYYFDIRVDNQIEDEVICKYDVVKDNKTRSGLFAEKDVATCEEISQRDRDRTFDIYEDESDYPGEIC